MDGSLARGLAGSFLLHGLMAVAWDHSGTIPPRLEVEAGEFSLEWTAGGESGTAPQASVLSAPAVKSPPAPLVRVETPPVLVQESPMDLPDAEEIPASVPQEAAPEPETLLPASAPAPRITGAIEMDPAPAADNPAPRYPEKARLKGEEGRVTVRAFVRPDGSVDRTELVVASGHGLLDEAALRAVERWRFRPAMHDGVPAAGEIDIPIHFVLKE